jgi:transcriptional regulator with XRE-family HTH domain
MPRKDPQLVTLGAVLRQFRVRRDLSQEALAARAKLDRTYVGGVERGERNVSYKNLARLLGALNVDWVEFAQALVHIESA